MDSCIKSQEAKISEFALTNDVYCNATWDGYICWPPTLQNVTANMKCPVIMGLDRRNFATRRCGEEGIWLDQQEMTGNSTNGWTNFKSCLTPELKHLLNTTDLDTKILIAYATRILEFVGYSISLVLIIASLIIFVYFQSLKNHRTNIHKHLMLAMLIQTIIRLGVYSDRDMMTKNPSLSGIHTSPVVCEAAYVILEFARTAMFSWFFVEGFYLNQVVVVSTLSFEPNYLLYYLLGWGIPFVITLIWGCVTATFMSHTHCWAYYNLTPYYWIIEGPRLAILIVNLLFLLATLRTLMGKLKNSDSRRVHRTMKAVRAAFVLVPLLGISNGLLMVKAPLKRSVVEFAVWAFCSHFLSSFQAVFVALLYCILNKEVRIRLKNQWILLKQTRMKNCQEEENLQVYGSKASRCANQTDRERRSTLPSSVGQM
ncbi:pdfr-1 (predicted) [Pycnogonum litorale]